MPTQSDSWPAPRAAPAAATRPITVRPGTTMPAPALRLSTAIRAARPGFLEQVLAAAIAADPKRGANLAHEIRWAVACFQGLPEPKRKRVTKSKHRVVRGGRSVVDPVHRVLD